jgi:hypothetical protein
MFHDGIKALAVSRNHTNDLLHVCWKAHQFDIVFSNFVLGSGADLFSRNAEKIV